MAGTDSVVLARLDLTDAPPGRIFDEADPDTSVEDTFFADWRLPLGSPIGWGMWSGFSLDEEDGRIILNQGNHTFNLMIAGDEDWADYTVAAHVRLISRFTCGTHDHGGHTDAMAGLIGRYFTNRQYYFFALCGDGFARLLRRDNVEWVTLAETPVELDRRRYYSLSLACIGDRLTATVDDDIRLEATDGTYKVGPAGINATGWSRFDRIEVTTTPEGADATDRRREQRMERLAELQSRWPQEKLVARIPRPDWPHEIATITNVAPGGQRGLLLYNSASTRAGRNAFLNTNTPPRLGVGDLEGRLLWGRDMPVQFPTPHDINGDGRDEILAVIEGRRIVVMSAADGRVLVETPVPSDPFTCRRGQPVASSGNPFFFADLRGLGHKADVIFYDNNPAGARTFWVYDENLNLRWRGRVGYPQFGHVFSACDSDGDGREELLAGFYCFDGDGKLLWNVREAEMNEDRHVDETQFGFFGPDGECRVGATNGDDGFYLLDGRTGAVISRMLCGHCQTVKTGNFLPDRPGTDYVVGTRWGSFGIGNVLDAEGNLVHRWEPGHQPFWSQTVRWCSGNADLILLSSGPTMWGLWDAAGDRVVRLDCPELPDAGNALRCATVMDYDGDGLDEILLPAPTEILVYQAAE